MALDRPAEPLDRDDPSGAEGCGAGVQVSLGQRRGQGQEVLIVAPGAIPPAPHHYRRMRRLHCDEGSRRTFARRLEATLGRRETTVAHLLEPTNTAAGRDVLWSHPAFANRHMYARNDKELICVDLAEKHR